MDESAPSSRGHTSSPSPSASVSTQDTQPKKRTRASKPKVRTGCITCKIRRVKCGEEKPACYRCTSTGRTCDGYDNGTPLRSRTPQQTLQEAEFARTEFLRTYQWNESLRSMRPIVADIDGTEMEKKFFHRFRTATENTASTTHLCTFAPFWTRLAPRIHRHDESVKHAAIALGAAYQLYELPNDPAPDGLAPEKIDVFIIQQYNKSISKLQRHVDSASPESIQVTLVCCLAYICLETLRSSHQAVVTHLLNGLKILQSLPIATFDFLSSHGAFASTSRDAIPITDNTQSDMADIIRIFGKLEYSASFFVPNVHPVVAERGYRHRRFDDGSRYPPFVDLRDAQGSIVCFTRDVLAWVYDFEQQTGPATPKNHSGYFFLADPLQQSQQSCLRERSQRLETLLVSDFLTRPGALPGTGAPDTPEVLCFYINLLHFRTAQLLLSGIDQNIPATSGASTPGTPFSPALSPWPQQQQLPIHHHPRQPTATTATKTFHFDKNIDPRLAAQTSTQLQTSSTFGALSPRPHDESIPTTPSFHHTSQLLPFPYLPFSNRTTTNTNSDISPNIITTRLREILHLAEILHSSSSAKKFRATTTSKPVSTGPSGAPSKSGSGNNSPSRAGVSSHNRRRAHTYSFTNDTGLTGPLSLVALAATAEDTDDSDRPAMKATVLRILKEYVDFTEGGESDDDGNTRGRNAQDREDEIRDEEERDIMDDNEGGRRFWIDYFQRLGLVELLPGAVARKGEGVLCA